MEPYGRPLCLPPAPRTLLELVRNRPLLAAELLGDALAARYREIVADARWARAHQAETVFRPSLGRA